MTSRRILPLGRFCSGDLAEPTAFFNSATGLGSNARIYLTGEETGPDGRGFATIVTGEGAGTAFELPYLGNLSYEIPAAGKTGTTNNNTDVWFVGYTPDLLAGVWLGFDQPKTITPGATGGGFAVPVWARVVRKYYQNHLIPAAWERPPDVVVRQVSAWTGKAVTDDCPYAVGSHPEYFLASSAPEPACEPPDILSDPTPWLPGRPVVPGEPRVPRPEDFIDSLPRRRGEALP